MNDILLPRQEAELQSKFTSYLEILFDKAEGILKQHRHDNPDLYRMIQEQKIIKEEKEKNKLLALSMPSKLIEHAAVPALAESIYFKQFKQEQLKTKIAVNQQLIHEQHVATHSLIVPRTQARNVKQEQCSIQEMTDDRAIKALFTYLSKNGCETIIDVDLKNFFGLIHHETLLSFLRIKIKDEHFIRYVARMLKSGIFKDGRFEVSDEGSAQGNICSPILSNIYAHYVLDVWIEEVVPQHIIKTVQSFRYADDQVICCQCGNDATRVQRALKNRLNKFGLQLNTDKTKVVKFNKRELLHIKQDTFYYLGFTFYIRRSRKGFAHVAIKTARTKFYSKLRKVKQWCKANKDKCKLRALWMTFNSKIRGHIQYYGVSLNSDRVNSFVYQATGIFFKWINRRSHRKSMTWEQFCMFRKTFPSPGLVHVIISTENL